MAAIITIDNLERFLTNINVKQVECSYVFYK